MANLIKKPDFFSPNIFKDFFEDDFFNDRFSLHRRMFPPVNVSEGKDRYQIEVSVPGINKENIKITREHDTLTISYEQEKTNEFNDKNYHRREFQSQSFTRSFNLPPDVEIEKITSTHKDGVLSITLPKIESAIDTEEIVDIKIQ